MISRLLADLRAFSPAVRHYLVGSALMGIAFAIPWTLLSLYLDRLGLSKSEIGSVASAQAWGRALAALPAAFLLASRRTVPVLVGTSLTAGLAYFVLPWLPDVELLALVSFVRGFADQVHHVAVAPFLFRHTEPRERAGAFAVAEAVHALMAVLGSFLSGHAVGWLAPRFFDEIHGMALVLTAAGCSALAAAPAFGCIREEERPAFERPAFIATIRRHRGLLLRFALPQFLIAAGAGLAIPFLGLYFQERFGFAPASVGTLFAGGQVLMTTGLLFTPELLRRAGYVRGIVLVELLSIPFFLVLAFTRSLPLAVAAFLFRGALMNSAQPLLKQLMMHASPEGLREVQNGLLGFLWGLAWVVGPLLGGAILDRTENSYDLLMCTTVGFYLTASLCSWRFLRPVELRLASGPPEAHVQATAE
jgi:predicted MFS family arabinose efflux permease